MTASGEALTGPISLRALGRAAGPLVFAGLVGQVFTIIRTLFVAARIGTAPALDALLVSLVLPIVVSGLLVSSLRTAIVPAYLEIARELNETHARRFVGVIVTWIALLGVAATALLVLIPEAAVGVSGPGLDEGSRSAAIRFMPLVAPILFLTAVSTMLGALCQVAGRFLPIALGLAIAPLASLLVTVGLWDPFGLDALALGLTLGAGVTLGLTVAYAARAGLLPPFALRANGRHLAGLLRHAVPLFAGSAVLQFNLLADRAVATLLSAGAVSALFYAGQIILLPIGSVAFAWQMVAYPSLVRAAQDGETGSLGAGATNAIRATMVVFTPIAVAAAALAPLLVGLAYRRGAFGVSSAELTVGAAAAFAPLLLWLMIQPILIGAHNARRHGTLLALGAVANAALTVVLNVVLGVALGVAGVALSTSVTMTVLLLYLARRLSSTEEGFALRPLLGVGGRALVASLVPGIPLAFVAWVWLPPLPPLETVVLLVGLLLAGLGGYLATARLLGLEDPGNIIGASLTRLMDSLRRRSS